MRKVRLRGDKKERNRDRDGYVKRCKSPTKVPPYFGFRILVFFETSIQSSDTIMPSCHQRGALFRPERRDDQHIHEPNAKQQLQFLALTTFKQTSIDFKRK